MVMIYKLSSPSLTMVVDPLLSSLNNSTAYRALPYQAVLAQVRKLHHEAEPVILVSKQTS